jgi:hypothetical protein
MLDELVGYLNDISCIGGWGPYLLDEGYPNIPMRIFSVLRELGYSLRGLEEENTDALFEHLRPNYVEEGGYEEPRIEYIIWYKYQARGRMIERRRVLSTYIPGVEYKDRYYDWEKVHLYRLRQDIA